MTVVSSLVRQPKISSILYLFILGSSNPKSDCKITFEQTLKTKRELSILNVFFYFISSEQNKVCSYCLKKLVFDSSQEHSSEVV